MTNTPKLGLAFSRIESRDGNFSKMFICAAVRHDGRILITDDQQELLERLSREAGVDVTPKFIAVEPDGR
jgi:hypothetical protein